MPAVRAAAAIASGKIARSLLRASGRGATALPGLVALAVDPRLVARLADALPHGAVCVSGTNGKTTCARMIADIARGAGWSPVHNRSGSNLDRGVAAALLADATWRATPRGDVGIFEVDEASLPRVLRRLSPRVVLVTNLFRDQLDRYHEIDALARRIGVALRALPDDTVVVLNADDPIVASLALGRKGPVITFGVDDPAVGGTVPQAISDATRCPRCGEPLVYRRIVLAHVGDWACPGCGLARPPRDVAAARVALGPDGSEMRLVGATRADAASITQDPEGGEMSASGASGSDDETATSGPEGSGIPSSGRSRPRAAIAPRGPEGAQLRARAAAGGDGEIVRVPLPGLYNAYNALAAIAVARVLEIPLRTATAALAAFRPAFGRLEVVSAEGRTLRLVLVKNPAGFNAAIAALLETGRRPRLLAALNDRDADGRDVSWIWDADFESLAPAVETAVVTGLRGPDLALRLKYAGVPRDRVSVVDRWRDAIARALADAPAGSEIVVLATYTAMLALRDALADMGHVGRFWED